MTVKKDGSVELTPIKTIVNFLMSYHGLNKQEFAEKYRVDASQVTRWCENEQKPRSEMYLRLLMEYQEHKDEELPILKQIS